MVPDKRIPSDGELLLAIQTGGEQVKREATDELCRRYDPLLLKAVVGYLWRMHCAHVEDQPREVVDSAWINILPNLGELRDLNNFEGWSRSIAINEANAHLRICINGRKTSVEFNDENLLPVARLNDYYKSRDAAIDAARMLKFAGSISSDFARVFTLYIVEELSFDDIAKRLGQNKEKIRTLYYRGRRQLMEKFNNGKN
jgi:RNA polymerase sigma factor (sigma-70 family)